MSQTVSVPNVRLLSASEFAAAIGKTERQVYRYIKKGRVDALSPEETGLPGVRIPESELERFTLRFGVGSPGAGVTAALGGSSVGASGEWEDSLEESGEQPAPRAWAPAPPAALGVPLERHEAAVMRVGYLEGQLEQSRSRLLEGDRAGSDLRQQVGDLQASLKEVELELLRAQVRAEAEADARREAEDAARRLFARLQQAEQKAALPWWRRLLGGGV